MHYSDLALHKKHHDPERKFDCEVCGREFNRLNNLQRHMMVHQQVRPVSCPFIFLLCNTGNRIAMNMHISKLVAIDV